MAKEWEVQSKKNHILGSHKENHDGDECWVLVDGARKM